MTDPRVEKLAKILVDYSVEVKKGDWVLVNASILALPLAKEAARCIARAGGHANTLFDSDELKEINLSESTLEQLDWVSPIEKMAIENVDVLISLRASQNTRNLSNIDPEKQRRGQLARREIMETYMRRSAEGNLRWTVTYYPCHAFAQDAEMSLSEYENFVYSACFADQPDPIQAWRNVHDRQQKLVEWLKGKKQVAVRGPNSDLTLSIASRPFINSSGKANMPDGEVFTGPVENSANGWVRFTYPAIHDGHEVEGVELEFKDGKVVKARASKNEDFLLKLIDSDPGSRYIGEFAIGTNYGIRRFTKSILFDEKIGGSFHMALGAGYPETGSLNKSSIHWDMICDMRDDSEILVDGELFYKNGEFVID
jgi:aminopeptidase